MHARLRDVREISEAAERLGLRLIDVREPPPDIPIATGLKRGGKRLLTVGTDCALGKKYTVAPEDHRATADLGSPPF